ncbi:MAG TPA: hypothetical protein VF992_08285 [Thermoplasmata archaeon]
MADDLASFLVSIWPYLVGAGGLVSAAAAVLALRSPHRRELRKKVLNPVYDYAVGLGSHEPEQVLAYGPWSSIPPSDWDRLRGRKKAVCEAFRTSTVEFQEALRKLTQHIVDVREAGLLQAFNERIGPRYVSQSQIAGDKVGLPSNYAVLTETLLRESYPHLLRHLDDRPTAWQEVVDSPAAHLFYVDKAVAFLQANDPKTLEGMYDVCTTHSLVKQGLEVVRVLDEKHDALLRQAAAVRKALKP